MSDVTTHHWHTDEIDALGRFVLTEDVKTPGEFGFRYVTQSDAFLSSHILMSEKEHVAAEPVQEAEGDAQGDDGEKKPEPRAPPY